MGKCLLSSRSVGHLTEVQSVWDRERDTFPSFSREKLSSHSCQIVGIFSCQQQQQQRIVNINFAFFANAEFYSCLFCLISHSSLGAADARIWLMFNLFASELLLREVFRTSARNVTNHPFIAEPHDGQYLAAEERSNGLFCVAFQRDGWWEREKKKMSVEKSVVIRREEKLCGEKKNEILPKSREVNEWKLGQDELFMRRSALRCVFVSSPSRDKCH